MTYYLEAPILSEIEPQGNTIIHLTDGSTIGAVGQVSEDIAQSIDRKTAIILYEEGSNIVLNPAHIVSAFYTKEHAGE